MADAERAAFAAGFLAGFEASAEGFNGECAFGHLAPEVSPETFSGISQPLGDAELTPVETALAQLLEMAYTVWLKERD